jgi:hypothetical protein
MNDWRTDDEARLLARAAGWQRKAALFHRGSVEAREDGNTDAARWRQMMARRAHNDANRCMAVAAEYRRERTTKILAPVVWAEGESQGLAVEDATELGPGHEVVGAADAPARASIPGSDAP